MSVTPGAANKLNHVSGIASAISLTEEDIQNPSLMGKILPKGFFINFPDGQIAVTDGTTAIGSLSKSVDKLLIGVEKDALVKTFSGLDKTYKATSGGFLVLGTDAKIDPISMPATVYDTATGKIKLDALPDSVRAGVSTIADYAGLSTVSEEQKKGLILVLDASADASVDKGAAMYQWVSDKNTFLKIAEVESLDIDLSALRPNYENIQAAGAIMYDHTLMLEPPSLTDMVALMEASLNNPGQPLETASYMEMLGSGGNFIFRIENESQVAAYWNTNGGANATFINAGKPAFKLILGPNAEGMKYFYASGQGAASGDPIVWIETPPSANSGTSAILQCAAYGTKNTTSGTTPLPFDNTIPQITEGDQYMSLAFTPKSETSKLIIDIAFVCSVATTAQVILALFKDLTTDAIATSFQYCANSTNTAAIRLRHIMPSPGKTESIFKLRVGTINGVRVYMNYATNGNFGGTPESSITIMEIV